MAVLRRTFALALVTLASFSAIAASDISTILNRLAQGVVDDEIVAELKAKLQTDPKAPAWWAWLGYAHCLRQEWDEAKEAYQRAEDLGAKPSFSWFPPTLPVSWFANRGYLRQLAISDVVVWQSPNVFCEPVPVADPKHGDKFSKVVFVYGSKAQADYASHFVQWLNQFGELPRHLSDVPSIFALALSLFSERFGMPVKFPVRAWLFAKGNGSAFSFAGHTLFYGSIPDDRWTWWLKVAHEAGHHAIPAFGEFDGLHEPYSGGFLGERLFALWLWDEGREVVNGDAEIERGLKNYLLGMVSAEIVKAQQWLLQAPKPEKPPMQVFLGLCLYLERLGGWDLLKEAMANAPKDTWDGFLAGFEIALSRRLSSGLTLRLRVPDANTPLSSFDISNLRDGLMSPSIQLAWWLPQGDFQCTVEVQGKGKLQVRWGDEQIAQWEVNASEPQTFSCTFDNPRAQWQRLRFWWLSGSGKILSVNFKGANDEPKSAQAKNERRG
jgi:hypothetical protein